jgi:hypothetical protein
MVNACIRRTDRRPLLGGSEVERAGFLNALEEARSAAFKLPDPSQAGNCRSCALRRNALRPGFRFSAGPFRCLGKIAVEPRPCQLVPFRRRL